MKCKICGATCRCKKAGPDICCSCHKHKAGEQAHRDQAHRDYETKLQLEDE
jgi:hypothetical protein